MFTVSFSFRLMPCFCNLTSSLLLALLCCYSHLSSSLPSTCPIASFFGGVFCIYRLASNQEASTSCRGRRHAIRYAFAHAQVTQPRSANIHSSRFPPHFYCAVTYRSAVPSLFLFFYAYFT
ncbi:uncharacterized protein EI90DRAFT_3040759 [Cantharellus anzutake]|uniref:uncharacterized protein n=1 Tax=Cantharellus anzutake TaxID=1750568 RepID=UPI0019062D2B|nr:uncharacterized protein EI90DRAFT_3040759 [Cantharellus anzutake]KAF8339191.1 hypothetical protein EI90DRAFT_3040759 [Cantharellus anzutake]